jgi:DNA-binding NtrC family response regulator
MSAILCVDRDPATRSAIDRALEDLGHRATYAESLDDALHHLGRHRFDLILCDDSLSDPEDASGFGLLDRLLQAGEDTPVIVMTAYSNVERAISLIRRGASNYLTKPPRSEALRLAIGHGVELTRLRRENDESQRRFRARNRIVGDSAALRVALETIAAVAPTRAAVLIEGESGTGKELFARAVHEQSPRFDGPFVIVNCAAMPEGLVESTLFGHERGAFVGAGARFRGAFERAHLGTLLLDEVAGMRYELQAKLLRALQEREFERVGGDETVRVDVRVVSTTNRKLLSEVEAGRFRNDLYYRLSVVPVHVPALRERSEDLPALVGHFVELTSTQLGIPAPIVSEETLAAIWRRPWPGNVRELMNAIERAVILRKDGRLLPEHFEVPANPMTIAPPADRDRAADADCEGDPFDLTILERQAIGRALRATAGNKARAARLLGISERTLRNKLRISPTDPGSRPTAVPVSAG